MMEVLLLIILTVISIYNAVKLYDMDKDLATITKRISDLNIRVIRALDPGLNSRGRVTDPFKGANRLPLKKTKGVIGTKSPARIRAEHSRELEKGQYYGWTDNNAG